MTTRGLHRWFGLLAALFGLAMAMTGAFLALQPVTEAARTGSLTPVADITVAELAGAVQAQIDGVTLIEKSANHTVWVHFDNDTGFGKTAFDPVTQTPVEVGRPSPVWAVVQDLHRSFLAGEVGRGVAGVTALAMLVLTASGLILLVRRLGGWGAVLSPPRSGRLQALHLDAGRAAVPGLLVLSVTGLWMSLTTFEILPNTDAAYPDFPVVDTALPARPLTELNALRVTPLAELRELVMPFPNDAADPYMLVTHQGAGYVDPTTGALVNFTAHSIWAKTYEFVYLLHTGHGAWVVGVLLGLSMLAVPFVIVSGVLMTLRRPRVAGRRGFKPVSTRTADCVILVGSETSTTWGFATTLARALTVRGKAVHLAAMDDLAGRYTRASHIFVLTATYGDGDAPGNATRFLGKLAALKTETEFSVLGFGDQSFPAYCKFAEDVDAAMRDAGHSAFLNLTKIDRQSAQQFNQWGQRVGQVLGLELDLRYIPAPVRTTAVQLIGRADFGQDVQAPTSILRLKPARGRLPAHAPGDLLGVMAPGCDVPRFYSLASSATDGCIEICVRKQIGGLCSGHLTGLSVGDSVEVFVKPNPRFKPARSKTPLILIGAGAGLGPLMGFARANTPQREAHLYWGGRHPASDFLYQKEQALLRFDGKLRSVHTAFSRVVDGHYVQDALAATASELREAILRGGQVMVCGGSAMGADVRKTWDGILAPVELSVAQLKSENRYLEDVY